jgi:hypothetical protein
MPAYAGARKSPAIQCANAGILFYQGIDLFDTIAFH